MGKGVFGLLESASFARALARAEGIRVKEEKEEITPYSMEDGTIVVGTPSLYSPDKYMGCLHREISKQMKDMKKIFFASQEEEGSLREVAKAILEAQRTEYHQHGQYEGRDRILAQEYKRTIMEGGGISQLASTLGTMDPTLGAMLWVGNEMRNGWQGYTHMGDVPENIKDEVNRIGPSLRSSWLSLETAQDLEGLLKFVTEVPPPPQGGEGEGDGEGEASGSGEADGSGDGDQGESGEGSGEGQGDKGQPQEGESGSQGPPGNPEQGTGESGKPGDTGESQKGDGLPGNEFSEAFTFLKDTGLTCPPVKYGEPPPETHSVPYVPCHQLTVKDVTTEKLKSNGRTEMIERKLGTFNLSKRIRKYMLATSQVGYEYGKTRGKISNRSISKLYSATGQPRIYKERQATKIKEDSAVFILGDCSGSMRGDKYTMSAACQISMSELLQGLRIPHMAMQFTTSSRNRVHYIMKKFDEGLVSRDKLLQRYGWDSISMGSNADGEAVMESASILARRPEKNKILIVLSDGKPAFIGDDTQYLEDVCKEVEGSGIIQLYGIGIMDNSVERYYAKHQVVNQLEELESVLIELLKNNILK